MNKKTEYWPTILIMEGRPYTLKKLERKGINNPCQLCDLRSICNTPKGLAMLHKLCKSDDRDDAWFFEEDWSIFDKAISGYLIDNNWLNEQNEGYKKMKAMYLT